MLTLLLLVGCFADQDYDGFTGRQDCDDTNPGVNPDALEVCDGIDDDCDGLVDEAASFDAPTWYADADSDGYGDAEATTTACDQPSGYVSDATDCDDAAATTYPGAAEICDGLDQDCDQIIDLGCLLVGETSTDDAPVRLAGRAEDRLGASFAPLGDLDGDGFDELLVGAWGHTDTAQYQGAVYVFSGDAEAGPKRTPQALELLLHPDEDTYLGMALAVADIDGDGHLDAVIGAPALDDNGTDAGGVYVLSGPLTAATDVASARNVLLGEVLRGTLGESVAADVESDVRVAAGGPRAEDNAGQVRLWIDPVAGEDVPVATIDGDQTGMAMGTSVALGDVDGDGLSDLFIGAPGGAGGTVLHFADPSGLLSPDDADQRFTLTDGLDESLGESVSVAGDLDGDGSLDLAIGAPRALSDVGAVYVWTGDWTGEHDPADAHAIVTGTSEGIGEDVAGAGDIDQDGFADLLVGAPRADEQYGQGFLVYGPFTGTVDPGEGLQVLAEEASRLGDGVGPVGDHNGDGFDDVGFGAPSWPSEDAGRVWVFFGGDR